MISAGEAMFPQLTFHGIRDRLPHTIAYEVTNQGDEAPFLLHLLRPNGSADPAQFESRSAAIMALHQDALAPLAHFGIASGHPCFFGADPGGIDFEAFADLVDTSAENIVQVVAEVAKALAVSHAAGVAHLGLTHEDVRVGSDRQTSLHRTGFVGLLADSREAALEIARAYPNDQAAYLAPELGDPIAQPDGRADLFAIGVLLYRGLTGRRPGGFFVLPSKDNSLDKRIDEIVSICLQVKPENRTLTAAAIAEELEELGYHDAEGFAERQRLARLEKRDANADMEANWMAHHSLSGEKMWKRVTAIGAALVVVGIGCYFAYQHYMKQPGAALSMPADQQKSVQELIDQLQAAQTGGGLLTVEQLTQMTIVAKQILESAPPGDPAAFKQSLDALTAVGAYDEAVALTSDYLASVPPNNPNRESLVAMREAFLSKLADYRAIMEEARDFADDGEDAAELERLQAAIAIFPDDPLAGYGLRANPIAIDGSMKSAMAELAAANGKSAGELGTFPDLRVSYRIFRGGVDIDLSGDRSVQDISSLKKILVRDLDLSGTGITDLTVVRSMPLRQLWIDDTEIADLSPISTSATLETLAFENTPVTEITVLDELPNLKVVRHNVGGTPVRNLTPPLIGSDWENELGMRFAPIEGKNTLVAIWETRVRDFRPFARSTTISLADLTPGTARDEESISPERFPVVNVSAEQATEFCEWLTEQGRKNGSLTDAMRYRLPTDAEWSKVAGSHPDTALSPAGRADSSVPAFAGEDGWPPAEPIERPILGRVGQSDRIGEFFGLAGNVREWTSSLPDSVYPGINVVRGGSADAMVAALATDDFRAFDLNRREAQTADSTAADLGFRVVLELRPEKEGATAESLAALVSAGDWVEIEASAKRIAADTTLERSQPELVAGAKSLLVLSQMRSFFLQNNRVPGSMRNRFGYFGGRRYYYAELPLDWKTADALATEVGGHLITIAGDEQREWISENYGSDRPVTAWTGASPSPEGAWQWMAGGEADSLPAAAPSSEEARLLYGHEFTPPPSPEGAGTSPAPDPTIPALPKPPSEATDAVEAPAPPVVAPTTDGAAPEGWTTQPAWREAPAHRRHRFIIEWG